MTMPMMVVCVARSERLISRTGFAPTTTTTTTTFDIAWRSFFFRLGHCVVLKWPQNRHTHTHTHPSATCTAHIDCRPQIIVPRVGSTSSFQCVAQHPVTVCAFPPRRRRPAIAHTRARAKHAFMCNNIYARERPNNVNELG